MNIFCLVHSFCWTFLLFNVPEIDPVPNFSCLHPDRRLIISCRVQSPDWVFLFPPTNPASDTIGTHLERLQWLWVKIYISSCSARGPFYFQPHLLQNGYSPPIRATEISQNTTRTFLLSLHPCSWHSLSLECSALDLSTSCLLFRIELKCSMQPSLIPAPGRDFSLLWTLRTLYSLSLSSYSLTFSTLYCTFLRKCLKLLVRPEVSRGQSTCIWFIFEGTTASRPAFGTWGSDSVFSTPNSSTSPFHLCVLLISLFYSWHHLSSILIAPPPPPVQTPSLLISPLRPCASVFSLHFHFIATSLLTCLLTRAFVKVSYSILASFSISIFKFIL